MNRIIVKGTSPYEEKQIAVFEVIKKTTIHIFTEKAKQHLLKVN